MTYVPTHLRYLPFDMAFTLNADDELMCVRLREDKTFPRRLSEYTVVDIEEWSEDDELVLAQIMDTLLGAA